MALEFFIKIGAYKGESMDDKHKGEIRRPRLAVGMSNGGLDTHGRRLGDRQVSVQDLSFTKYSRSVSSPGSDAGRAATESTSTKAMMTLRKAAKNRSSYYTSHATC